MNQAIVTVRVCAVDELEPGRAKAFNVDGREGIVVRVGDEFFSCQRYCTHEKFPLEFGRIKDGARLCCTYHGAEFDLRTGNVEKPPATTPLTVYPVRIDGTDVLVDLPAEA
jgi:3-phenylpropionate/trans-cinnamate dioxygenase ferredoxin subunit